MSMLSTRRRALLLLSWFRLKQRRSSINALMSAMFVASLLFLTTSLFAAVSKAVPANFVKIPAGEFTMGSPASETNRDADETQHQVRLSSFYMSKYEVTIGEFRDFLEATGYVNGNYRQQIATYRYEMQVYALRMEVLNPLLKANPNLKTPFVKPTKPSFPLNEVIEEWGHLPNYPMFRVNWDDAVAYCDWLSAKTGKKYRLPTEAEWEYACRAGSTTAFNTGNNLTTEQANYNRNTMVPVESFAPNAWGLYNMHGNVYEWCSDWYGEKYYDECKAKGVVENPQGPATGSRRVVRGGSWDSFAGRCRSANRGGSTPDFRSDDGGFRLVFVP